MIRYLPLAAALTLAACSAPESDTPSAAAAPQSAGPQTDEQKTIYALGLAISTNLAQFNLTADEVALVADGLRDGVLGNEPKADLQMYGPRIQLLAQERAGAAAGARRVGHRAGEPTRCAAQ
jgi:hypothetical protein